MAKGKRRKHDTRTDKREELDKATRDAIGAARRLGLYLLVVGPRWTLYCRTTGRLLLTYDKVSRRWETERSPGGYIAPDKVIGFAARLLEPQGHHK